MKSSWDAIEIWSITNAKNDYTSAFGRVFVGWTKNLKTIMMLYKTYDWTLSAVIL